MRVALLVLVLLVLAGLTLSPVHAWDNGGSNPKDPDYGTHDWIAQHAWNWQSSVQQTSVLSFLNLADFLYGTGLPDNDTLMKEMDGGGGKSKHHVYFFANGSIQDNASAQWAQQQLEKAVSLFKAGNFSEAAKRLGMMTHYISDVASFGHVMGEETCWGAEDHHGAYESYVETRTDNYSGRANDTEFSSFLKFDEVFENISAYDATIFLANDTTFDSGNERNCFWMDQNYNGSDSDPIFWNRCGESLNLATNLVADVLHTFITRVRPVGDVNGDDRVDMKDVSYVARRFYCFPSNQLWDPAADLNGDGKIDMKDLAIPSHHFSEHYQ